MIISVSIKQIGYNMYLLYRYLCEVLDTREVLPLQYTDTHTHTYTDTDNNAYTDTDSQT